MSPDIEIFPAFDYGQDDHVTTIHNETAQNANSTDSKVATFHSSDVKLQLNVVMRGHERQPDPTVTFSKKRKEGMKGDGLVASVEISGGESISFVLRDDETSGAKNTISPEILDEQQSNTLEFWHNFISQTKYRGHGMEMVSRSLMFLKMMTYGTSQPQMMCFNASY